MTIQNFLFNLYKYKPITRQPSMIISGTGNHCSNKVILRVATAQEKTYLEPPNQLSSRRNPLIINSINKWWRVIHNILTSLRFTLLLYTPSAYMVHDKSLQSSKIVLPLVQARPRPELHKYPHILLLICIHNVMEPSQQDHETIKTAQTIKKLLQSQYLLKAKES